jgi:hypothetical protein
MKDITVHKNMNKVKNYYQQTTSSTSYFSVSLTDVWKNIFVITVYKFSLNKKKLISIVFTFERSYWNVCYQCIELVWGIFILVSTACQPHSYSEWYISIKCIHSYLLQLLDTIAHSEMRSTLGTGHYLSWGAGRMKRKGYIYWYIYFTPLPFLEVMFSKPPIFSPPSPT